MTQLNTYNCLLGSLTKTCIKSPRSIVREVVRLYIPCQLSAGLPYLGKHVPSPIHPP